MIIVGVVMSLREFIRATAKEFQDANKVRTSHGAAAKQKDAGLGTAAVESGKAVIVGRRRRRRRSALTGEKDQEN